MADRQVRYAMKDSISVSLASGAGHRSDQGRVWREVGELHQRHGTVSPTAAMRDAYQSRKPDLDAVLAAFPLQEGQQGMLVLHGARVVGLDLGRARRSTPSCTTSCCAATRSRRW